MKHPKIDPAIVAQNATPRKYHDGITAPAAVTLDAVNRPRKYNADAVNRQTFEEVKRAFETAYACGRDYSRELFALAAAIAYSILNKLADPQRSTAPARDCVSNSGMSPVMLKAKQDIFFDTMLLDNTAAALTAASTYEFNKDAQLVRVVVDKAQEAAAAILMAEPLGDGLDFVNEAAAAILEQAAIHAAPGVKWLDMEVSRRRLSKRVYIDPAAAPEYTEEATTPIQEVYRTVRRYVQTNRAVNADPRNGYTYADLPTADGLDTIYYRSGRYADIGGYDCNGNYTADHATMLTRSVILARLNLSTREAFIISKREQGFSVEAIAAALKVDPANVSRIIRRIQDKAAAIGVAPSGWTADSRKADPARPVEQIDPRTGERIAVYASVTAAANMTGVDKGNIAQAANGKRKTAAGYIWQYI